MGRLKRKNPFKKSQNAKAAQYQDVIIRKSATEYLSESLKEEIYDRCHRDISEINSIWLMCAFALALHRELGFGRKRVMRMLQAIDDIAGELDGIEPAELADIVEREVDIRIESGGTHDSI